MKKESLGMKTLLHIVLFCCAPVLVRGVGSWNISPGLSKTDWALNYVGPMYTVTYNPTDLELDYVWTITPTGATESFSRTFSTAACTNRSISLSGFTADCGNGDILLSAIEPFSNPVNLTLTANGPRFSVSFTLRLGTIGCQSVNRQFSRPLQNLSGSQCGFNCSVTYACLPGYLSGVGSTYNTKCTSLGVLEPSELCVFVGSPLPPAHPTWWHYLIIGIGSFIIIAGVVAIIVVYRRTK